MHSAILSVPHGSSVALSLYAVAVLGELLNESCSEACGMSRGESLKFPLEDGSECEQCTEKHEDDA
jgi:hypothetical protein